MLYTVGMALSRAGENGYPVSILVDGCWLHGKVAANDGTGLVLEGIDGQHSIAKIERIAAVTVQSESPYKASIGSVEMSGSMPGPRPSYV
jgi:hypothetical protein